MADDGVSPRSQMAVYCSICLLPFTNPKLLPCFHTFCVKCLELSMGADKNELSVKCPACRRSSLMPAGGLDKLPTNDYISTTDGEVEAPRPPSCDVCGPEVLAVHNCTVCEENYCERCTLTHAKMKLTKSHYFVQIDSGEDQSEKDQFCLIHPNGQFEFLCTDCRAVICFACKENEHRQHNCCYINDEAVRVREQLQNVITNARTTIDVFRNVIAEQRLKQKHIRKMFSTELEKLKTHTEQLISNIKDQSAKIEQQLDQYCKFRLQEADENEAKLTQDIVTCITLTETGRGLLATADDNQLVTSGQTFIETILRIRQPRKFYYRISLFSPGTQVSESDMAEMLGNTDMNHLLI